MTVSRNPDLAALETMTVAELRERYVRLFGEATTSHNRLWLLRRIAWRMQALAEGDLSQRAQRRIAELANDADLRLSAPRRRQPGATFLNPCPPRNGPDRDARLRPGAVIVRPYKGTQLQVKVLEIGFEYQGTTYRSLSAVAKAITGAHCSGYGFFHLRTQEAS